HGSLDHAQPELAGAVGRGIQTPLVEQGFVRIDPDAQRAVLREDAGQQHAEVGHSRAARISAYSCRLVTSYPSCIASIAVTAAPSVAIVVKSALSAATAAARIS